MDISPWSPDMAQDVAAAYNRAFACVPFCYRVPADVFAAEVARPRPEFVNDPPLQNQRQLVARDGQTVLGFIDVGVRPPKSPEDKGDGPADPQGIIRCLWYAPGHRVAGQQLLDEAEAHLRDAGVPSVFAFDQPYNYRFYQFHSSFLSTQLGHVEALLGRAGYHRSGGEVFMALEDLAGQAAMEPEAPLELRVEGDIATNRFGTMTVEAYSNDQFIGACDAQPIGGYTDDPDAMRWAFIPELYIEGPYQGRGIGKAVLVRTLVEIREAGYPCVAISTAWDNYRAFLFYTNLGFRVVDWTWGWKKQFQT